ncbi:MAG: transglutaminase family protein [Oceanospirillaceae bacterium]|nr:transglutaminase family protein [Oceanospirillaceae bacterium]
MDQYLAHSTYIDWKNPEVFEKAQFLAAGVSEQSAIVKRCFEFVRDEIKHSSDFKLNPVTCKASDVLKHGTGFCYAKSHLLAALLRANGVATGLCYQRLTLADNKPPFCLHGLNAVYLEDIGWYRLDPRGNKEHVDAQFCPPTVKLAFAIVNPGEADFPEIWAEPLSVVVDVLNSATSFQQVLDELPDVEIAKL